MAVCRIHCRAVYPCGLWCRDADADIHIRPTTACMHSADIYLHPSRRIAEVGASLDRPYKGAVISCVTREARACMQLISWCGLVEDAKEYGILFSFSFHWSP